MASVSVGELLRRLLAINGLRVLGAHFEPHGVVIDVKPRHRKVGRGQHSNKRLYRAYLLKESLAKGLDYRQVNRADGYLRQWREWASHSWLRPFVRLSRTVNKHLDGILAYVKTGLSNGPVEALNNKVRLLIRRAYGFHGSTALKAMVYLCCGGIQLSPPLPGSTLVPAAVTP